MSEVQSRSGRQGKRGRAAVQLAKVKELIDALQFDEAERTCTAALAERPRNASLHAMLGYVEYKRERYEEAIEACSRARDLKPEDWTAQFVLGMALKALGRLDEACEPLEKAVSIAPDVVQSAQLFLEVTEAFRGIDAAREVHQRLSSTARNDPGFATSWGYRLFDAGLNQEANAAFGGAHGQASLVAAPIVSVSDWAAKQGIASHPAGEIEEVPFVEPTVWGQRGSPGKPVELKTLSNRPYATTLQDVTIFGDSSLILTRDHTVLNDTASHPAYGRYVDFSYDTLVKAQRHPSILLGLAAVDVVEIDGGVMLSGLASGHFGHWVPEFLPKLQFLEQHPDYARLPLIVDENMPESHFDYLRLVTSRPVLHLPKGTAFRCKELLVAPTPTFYPVELVPHGIPQHEINALSPRGLRFLRDHVIKRLGPAVGGVGRYFLGRKNMRWRRMLNEDEIAAFLEAAGFETVYPENLPLVDQIRLFQSAEIIVAAGGSSLLNLMYSNSGVRVVVLSQANLFNWGGFAATMGSLGYHPLFVCGDEVEASGQKHADFRIPVGQVRAALGHLGVDTAPA